MANYDETNMFEEFGEALENAASSDVPPPSNVPNTSPPLILFTSNAISTTHTNDCKDCREDRYHGNNKSKVNYSKEIKDSDVVSEEDLQKIKSNNKLLYTTVLAPWMLGKTEDMPQRKPKYPTKKQKKRKKEQNEKGKKKTLTKNESADDKVHPLIGVPLGNDEDTGLPLVDPIIILMSVQAPNVKKWTSEGRDKFHRVMIDNQEEFIEQEQEHALSTIKIINDCEALGLTFLSAKKSTGGQWVYCETRPKNDDYTGKRADRGCLQNLVYRAVYCFWKDTTSPGYKTVLNNVKEERRQKKESLNEIQSLLGRVDELRLGNPTYKSESLRAEKIDRVKEYNQYCLEVNTAREEQKKIDAGVKVEVSILLFIEYTRTYTHIVIYRIVIYRT